MPVEFSPSNQQPISAKPKNSSVGVGCLFFFFSIFTLVGAGVFYFFSVRPIFQVIAAKSWPSVPCQITGSRVASSSNSDGTSYSAVIDYSYSFQGQNYWGNKYAFGPNTSSSSYARAQRRANSFPVGLRTQCFVNPKAPGEAVLNRDFKWEMGIGGFGLIFLLVGLGVPASMWRQHRRQMTPGNRADSWQPSPSIVLANTPNGVQLKPSSASPTARMVGAWLLCLFWNGITGGVGWGMLRDLRGGLLTLFPLLFLVPFVLVGALLVWLAVYSSLGLFNPRPVLTFPSERFHPGDSLEVQWQLKGIGKRPQSVQLVLEGHEEVKFTRGTDTITQKQIFYTTPLYLSPPGNTPTSGIFQLEIPRDTMHSFEAPHNAIRWKILFTASQHLWPGIEDEWTLLVEPSATGAVAPTSFFQT